MSARPPMLFALAAHPLSEPLLSGLQAEAGHIERRRFPDGETWLRIAEDPAGRACVLLADMVDPDAEFLALVFAAATLREMGAASVGLVLPYLCYMRQDARFGPGEAVTSRIFAALLSSQADWLVTVDPHLHRHKTLDAIYAIPSRVVHGAPVLAEWLGNQDKLLLVGPDEESAQWVSRIAAISGHPWVCGSKTRLGDRQVQVVLPELSAWPDHEALIIDDVISSGHTVLRCMEALRAAGVLRISCACVHGIFADGIDARLREAGLLRLVSCNTVPHATNALDVSPLICEAVRELLK